MHTLRFHFTILLGAISFAAIGSAQAPAIKKILVNGQPAEVVRDWQTASDKVRLVTVNGRNAMEEIVDADAFIGEPGPELIRAAKKLQWVQTPAAGVERMLHLSGSNEFRDSNIILTNNQIVQGPEIADHAMAMLLALSRNLPLYFGDRQKANWRRERFTGIELNGKNGVIIGCGGIGMQIAVRAWAHGMKLTCVDPEDLPFSPFVSLVVKPDRLNDVLPSADAVFISAPHTAKSHKMMGSKQFDLMKKGSYFIAVSRGGIYELPALVKALDEQRLAGAGVDVTDPEPLPADNALWKFENAIITPHIAGRSDQDAGRMRSNIKENIRRFAEGLPLHNVVDKQKGY
jgi:phosphoglycerate dehydrogenase-like enzyme